MLSMCYFSSLPSKLAKVCLFLSPKKNTARNSKWMWADSKHTSCQCKCLNRWPALALRSADVGKGRGKKKKHWQRLNQRSFGRKRNLSASVKDATCAMDGGKKKEKSPECTCCKKWDERF